MAILTEAGRRFKSAQSQTMRPAFVRLHDAAGEWGRLMIRPANVMENRVK